MRKSPSIENCADHYCQSFSLYFIVNYKPRDRRTMATPAILTIIYKTRSKFVNMLKHVNYYLIASC